MYLKINSYIDPLCYELQISIFILYQVLVYDKTGQNVIGPLLSVKDLRELGVTLHLPLHSERFVFRPQT